MWGFGAIGNQSDQTLLVDYAVGPGGTSSGGQLNSTAGDAILEIGSLGALYFTDMGHQSGGPHWWAVDVAYNDQVWRWFYDGVGSLDVAIAVDGSFTLSGSGQQLQGQLIQPPGPDEGLVGLLETAGAEPPPAG